MRRRISGGIETVHAARGSSSDVSTPTPTTAKVEWTSFSAGECLRLSKSNYKEVLSGTERYHGVTKVALDWDGETGAEGFHEMATAFAEHSGFKNVATISITANALHLDGSAIKAIGKGKPLVETLDLSALSYADKPPAHMSVWTDFKQLHSVSITLTDSFSNPRCFNQLVTGLPRIGVRYKSLRIEENGPYYGVLECMLVPTCCEFVTLVGLTLRGRSQLEGAGSIVSTADCKDGDQLVGGVFIRDAGCHIH